MESTIINLGKFKQHFAAMPIVASIYCEQGEEGVHVAHMQKIGVSVIEFLYDSKVTNRYLSECRDRLGDNVVLGIGGATCSYNVREAADSQAQFLSSPLYSEVLQAKAKSHDLFFIPSAATPKEAFGILDAGITIMKVFPAEQIPGAAIAVWKDILPKQAKIIACGHLNAESAFNYFSVGASGLWVQTPKGASFDEVRTQVGGVVDAYKRLSGPCRDMAMQAGFPEPPSVFVPL